jgi:hypothetical protein
MMNISKKTIQICQLLLLVCLIFITQCSSTAKKEKEAFEVVKVLVAAGFTYKVAEDDAMLAKMTKLPQHKIIRHERQGQAIWVYPDVVGCKCIYAGDDTHYKRLQELLKENKQHSHRFGGSGSDPGVREMAATEMLDIDDGMLPEM